MIDGLHHCPRCSYDLTGERSSRAHRYMHVVLAIALENWPEKHPHIRPRNVAELRAWVFCQDAVDFFDSISAVAMPGASDELGRLDYYAGHMRAIRDAGGYGFLFQNKRTGGIELRIPRSSALAKNGGPDRVRFTAILTRMLDEIIVQTGMDRELLRTRARKDLEPRRLGARCAA